MRINVNIPIRVAVDLDSLEHRPGDLDEALAAATTRALKRSSAATAPAGDPTGVVVHDPTFAWRGVGLKTVPTDTRQDTEARLARVIQRSARSGAAPASGSGSHLRRRQWRGWRVQTNSNFHTTVGEYANYLEDFSDAHAENYATLYEDYADQTKWVSLWLVQVDRTSRRHDISQELITRALQLSHPRAGRDSGLWVLGATEAARRRLMTIDRDGVVGGAVPDLSRSEDRWSVYDGEVYLQPGALLMFTMMIVPAITLETYARQDRPFDIEVRYRDLEFMVNQPGFQNFLHISWPDFIAEMGDQTTPLHIMPVEITASAPPLNVQDLTEARDLPQPAGPTARRIRDFRLLNQATLDALPANVRAAVAPHTNATTLALDNDSRWARWQVGWRGAQFSAPFELTADQQFAVNNRPYSVIVADAIVDLLGRYPDDSLEQIPWWGELTRLFKGNFSYTGDDGVRTMFDMVMENLERRDGGRWFTALLDRLAPESGDATLIFIQAATASLNYRDQPRIAQMRADYNAGTREALENAYYPKTSSVWLHKDPDQRVGRGEVVADAFSDYVSRAKVQNLVESRRAEFDKALEKAANDLLEDIMHKRVSKEFSNDEFANEAINRAAAAIHLTNDDFEKVTQLTSLRVTNVETRVDRGIERYWVTYNVVQKIDGEGDWKDLPGTSQTRTELEFEWLLWGWGLGRMGERFQTFGLVIAGIAVIAVAWEVGLVGAMVSAAGGTGVVLTSIAISEILYLVTAKHYSLEGFVIAAIDGYLFALTFRFGGWAGRGLALKIGRATMPKIVGGWIAERLVTGVVGGSLGGAAVVFSHGLAETLLHQGAFPTLGDFVKGMEMGAVFGLFGEFVIGPVLQGAFRVGGQTVLNTIEDAAGVIQRSGTSPARYIAEISQALSAIRARLGGFLEEASVKSIIEGLRERMAAIGEGLEALPGAARRRFQLGMLRRVFELSDIGLGSVETDGLERLLSATEAGGARMSSEELVAFLNRLAADRGRAQLMLNVLGKLSDDRVGALVAGGQLDAVASAGNLLKRLTGPDLERAWSVLVGPSFRLSAADFEAFLGRIAAHPEGQQTSALELLRRPEQLVTPEGVALAIEKGGLGDGVAEGLDRLYGALESAAADGVLRGAPHGNVSAYLRYLGSLRQEIVNDLATAGYLEPLTGAPRVVDYLTGGGMDSARALTGAHGPFGPTVAEAVAGFDTFLGALEKVNATQREAAINLILRPTNRVPPSTVLRVLEAGIPLDADVQRGLDHIYRDPNALTAEQIQRLTGSGASLRNLYRNDIPLWTRLGHIDAIVRNDEVMALLRHGANTEPFRTFTTRYPGNEGAAIDALNRLLTRVRGLNLGDLESFEATDLLQSLIGRGGARPIAEIDQIASEIGQSTFPRRSVAVGARTTVFPSAAEEARAFVRLMGDNVTPVQAQTMLTLPTDVNITEAAVAGEGAIGPDVLFTTSTGEAIGREAVATAIPVVDPANPLAALDRNLSGASLEHKISAYEPSGVVGRRPGIRWLRKEIDVRVDASNDGFNYDALLGQMQADGSLAPWLDRVIRGIPGSTNIGRIRFYNSQGAVIHVWTP